MGERQEVVWATAPNGERVRIPVRDSISIATDTYESGPLTLIGETHVTVDGVTLDGYTDISVHLLTGEGERMVSLNAVRKLL